MALPFRSHGGVDEVALARWSLNKSRSKLQVPVKTGRVFLPRPMTSTCMGFKSFGRPVALACCSLDRC